MKDRNYGLYALAVAVLVVGALWLGLPVSGLLAIVLVCPLMMFFMMKGMHSGDSHGQSGSRSSHDGTNR